MKNLIAGTLETYRLEQIKPFFNSLQAANVDADVVVFVSNIDVSVRNWLVDRGVKLVDYWRLRIKGIRHLRELFRLTLGKFSSQYSPGLLGACYLRLWHCQASRYFMYRDFLGQVGQNYNCVMLTDIRDVFFQADPFENVTPNKLSVFEETSTVPLGKEPFNSKWIKTLFGAECFDVMSDFSIICSGVTIGGTDSVVNYLDRMTEYLVRFHEPNGFDQGVHNYLIRNDLIDQVDIYCYGDGPVLNLGIVSPSTIKRNDAGEVLLQNGEVSSVVHQYDRIPELIEYVTTKFGGS